MKIDQEISFQQNGETISPSSQVQKIGSKFGSDPTKTWKLVKQLVTSALYRIVNTYI